MLINTVIVLATLGGLCWLLYSRRVQQSDEYQALVVPLANIMDIGFVAMTPLIVHLTGLYSPLMMLGLCALGFAMGWVTRYNIRHYEPIAGQLAAAMRIAAFAQFALLAASAVNVAYYVQLMAGVIVYPFGLHGGGDIELIIAVGTLVLLGTIGFIWGLGKLNEVGARTTAFNLAAVVAIIAGFLAYNVEHAVEGTWSLPDYSPLQTEETLRQMLGFFALVQGFEASRYMGGRFSADRRVHTMKAAQIIATIAFVLFPASTLLFFAELRPEMHPAAVVQIAVLASPVLPWLVLALAAGSEGSASINAIMSRSDVMMELFRGKIPRRLTYPLLALASIAIVLVTDVTSAVAAASRVFATYYTLQCVIAVLVARREKQWAHLAGVVAVGLAMLTIAIFGLST